MSVEDRAYLVGAGILGVLGAIAITKSNVNIPQALFWWLVYATSCGILINTQQGRSFLFLVVGGLISSASLVAALGVVIFFNEGELPISGNEINCINRPVYASSG